MDDSSQDSMLVVVAGRPGGRPARFGELALNLRSAFSSGFFLCGNAAQAEDPLRKHFTAWKAWVSFTIASSLPASEFSHLARNTSKNGARPISEISESSRQDVDHLLKRRGSGESPAEGPARRAGHGHPTLSRSPSRQTS
jgi:hypothetical protein